MIAEQLEQMLKTDANPKGIFHERPHMTWDNFFSGDSIMNWLGQKGFAATMTCRRDRLPKDVPKHFFHHEKGISDQKSKVARFLEPITAVQHYPPFPDEGKKAYTRTHVSFQSTGATNISTVNALNSSQLYAVVKQRGIGDEKRQWGIEMNEARLLYLKTYGRIDTIDSLINHSHMNYRSQKYWHSAMIEALALAVVTAYDMYLEAASGSLCPEWKLEKPMSFHTFRDRLSSQALQYKARNKFYPGDDKTRAATQQVPIKKRTRIFAKSVRTGGERCANIEEFNEAKKNKRLCGDLGNLSEHLLSFCQPGSRFNHGAKCAFCGETCYTKCLICNVPLHNFPKKGKSDGKDCSIHYHNDARFGLAYRDAKELGSKSGVKWVLPCKAVQDANAKHIRTLADL